MGLSYCKRHVNHVINMTNQNTVVSVPTAPISISPWHHRGFGRQKRQGLTCGRQSSELIDVTL